MKIFRFYTVLFLVLVINVCSAEYFYILDEKSLNDLYYDAIENIKDTQIQIRKDVRGIVISLALDKFNEQDFLSESLKYKLLSVGNFLVKNKKSVIIEVHTVGDSDLKRRNLKNWELSQIIAGDIEDFMLKAGMISYDRIKSVGYGDYFPKKNTSNNGVNEIGSIDIIILCNISGE